VKKQAGPAFLSPVKRWKNRTATSLAFSDNPVRSIFELSLDAQDIGTERLNAI
jgi:hypothetical protein